jgi:hypothetical protein
MRLRHPTSIGQFSRAPRRRDRIAVALVAAAVCSSLVIPMGCGRSGRTERRAPVLYPLPPSTPRIAYLTSIDHADIFEPQTGKMEQFLFGRNADVAQPISKPFGLAAGQETLLVCDTERNVVHAIDFKTGRADVMGAAGRGRLLKPVDVTMDKQGNRYVADTLRREVVVFDTRNQADRAIGGGGDDPFKPVAVDFYDGKLYVLNAVMHRVEVLDPNTGDVQLTFGEEGDGPGQMLWPSGLAVGPKGCVYVTDIVTFRVEVFGPDGEPLRHFGRPGNRPGEFTRPKHLAVGPDGIVYVADAGIQRVQMFDDQDRVLMLFGGPGSGPGDLMLPGGICVDASLLPHFADDIPEGFDAEYLVLVSDQFGARRVNVYAFGRM